jgi:hypothetical protein
MEGIILVAGLLLLCAAGAAGIYTMFHLRRQVRSLCSQVGTLYQYVRAIDSITAPNPVVSPISFPVWDWDGSPHTGLGRPSWTYLAEQLLIGLLFYSDGLKRRLRLPSSSSSAYPCLEVDGTVFGEQENYLETFCRSLWLAAPLLSQNPDWQLEGRSVADYYREYLVRGALPFDEASFGLGRTDRPTPHIMEAAAVCIALKQARKVLWDPLAARERERLVSWLENCSRCAVHTNNWRWFSVVVNTFLKTEGYRHKASVVQKHLMAIREFYVDAGWFRDGARFDYYSAWSLQFYPVFWALWDGDSNPELRDEFYERNDHFLQSFTHIFSKRGEIPLWGRSPIYRFGAAAPFPVAFLRPSAPAIDPGFVRRLSSGCLLQFTKHPGFLRHGLPSLGFQGEQASVVDGYPGIASSHRSPKIFNGYSGIASSYWCAKIFVALTLPGDSPFWTATENEGFWTNPPSRYDIGRTGMWVLHDAATGHSKLYAPQQVTIQDFRYTAPLFDTADAVCP